ncbi:MAG: class IV adenylate cyclase [Thermoanaerobaculia bacterium]|nr:class IV adenylate cyclase [Thermoanaerobaculia bacterium]
MSKPESKDQVEDVERELKFANVDHSQLRSRLGELEAEQQGPPALEDNYIFDRDGELAADKKLLRLRVDRSGCRITFKGPAHYEGTVKVRGELETTLGDVETGRAILEALGYEQVARYQKYREEWLLGSQVISLDHTPIGDFAEFEGKGCDRVARRCGLDVDSAERRNYLRLYEDHVAENPDADREMVFAGEKGRT